MQVHTSDDVTKVKALRSNQSARRRLVLIVLGALFLVLSLLPRGARAGQQYELAIDVGAGGALRSEAPVDAVLDLTAFLGSVLGTLDPTTFQVVEVDSAGGVLDSAVAFQFDPAAGFDPATFARGNLVFVLSDTTGAYDTRHFRLRFDLLGACGDCPPPPSVLNPVAVDSLVYEGQMTYVVDTPAGDYYYHRQGAGLASFKDPDGNDWISFHNTPGSGSSGEYRGIPNLVFTANNAAASFFHPGFTNATSTVVGHGPLKVSVRSVTSAQSNEWIVLWEFYRNFARLTVEQIGTSNGGAYWFLYEGTPGGALDAGDVVVRSDGTSTSATDGAGRWETTLPDPQWVYFRNTSSPRYLYVSDNSGDADPDSYRSMGPSGGADPDMTVFGLGRVLDTSAGALTPRMTGVGRTFTLGFGEDHVAAPQTIAAATLPMQVTVGDPIDNLSAVTDNLPQHATLQRNYPNPFNPQTTIGFALSTADQVELSIFDASGRLTRNLVASRLQAGNHSYVWDGRDQRGRMAASGVYLYRLKTASGLQLGKMTLIE